jgi:hypothetical protein
LHASRTGYYLGTGPDILADNLVYFILSYPYLAFSCSVLGECCSVAGVCGVAQESCDLSIRSASIERGKYRNECSGSLRLEALSRILPGSISHSHVFPGEHGRIRLHPRDLPRRVLLSLQPCPPPSSASLSGCYRQRFVRTRVKLATAVSSSSPSSSCTPSRHASLLSTAQRYMYYPCASCCWQ